MFKIEHKNNESINQEIIELYNTESSTYAKILLNEGARIEELVIGNHHIIKDMKPLEYSNTYASSILFPFANRIKDGCYKFEDNYYQFDINEEELNNAIHGLVFNKTFKVINTSSVEEFASVKLVYHESKKSKGFPYTYSIYIDYILTENTLNLKVEIKNTDFKTFPFTLGWHPYFLSNDLYNSSIIFDSNKKLKLDSRNITAGIEINENVDIFNIKNQSLDDCYILNTNNVEFQTPKYVLNINSSENDNFLQLYTPPHQNTIAIEPTTGVSDSFNNGIGLKTLNPNDSYCIEWKIKITDK